MKECFSFRQTALDTTHHHRLMYLHSTPHNNSLSYNSCQRIRTMPNQYESQSKNCETLKNNIQRQKSCSYKKFETAPIRSVTSQKQIKYFKLDLSKIINSSQITQPNHNNLNQYKQKTTRAVDSVLDRFTKIDKQSINSNDLNKLPSNLKQSGVVSKAIHKILNSNQAQLHEIYSEGKLKQNIKVNTWHKNKDLEGKYNRLRNNYGYRHPKVIKPSQFFQKTVKKSQIRQQLELKRLQKILIDKSGHQFRITIQKIN